MSKQLTPLDLEVRKRIGERGFLPYAEFVELALYDPEHGFYSRVGKAGRRGDFITSPEVGPLFGHLVANALDIEWDRLGQPDVFTVVDYGAGPGTLARSVAAASPRCSDAMRYVAIERSVEQRALHPEQVLSLEELSPEIVGDGITGVVIANEMLDNLAFSPVVRPVAGEPLHLQQLVLGENEELELAAGDPLEPALDGVFDASVEQAVLQLDARDWLAETLESIRAGRVIVIDYARRASELVEIRTYAEHGHAGDPLQAIGSKDITVDVDLQQLERLVGEANSIQSQASWLAELGIEELVEEGRALWAEGAASGSLAALKARSRVREAEALVAEDGLGGFLVAQWQVD